MLVDFDVLGPDARIWVYQSDRTLSDEEVRQIQQTTKKFVESWTAHGKGLKGGCKIVYNQFLILGVDQNFNQASGCSIDASVQFISQIENQFSISLTDRSKVAILIGNEVILEDFRELKDKVRKSEIDLNSKTFNNFITTKEELEKSWISPIEDSWLKKYL